MRKPCLWHPSRAPEQSGKRAAASLTRQIAPAAQALLSWRALEGGAAGPAKGAFRIAIEFPSILRTYR